MMDSTCVHSKATFIAFSLALCKSEKNCFSGGSHDELEQTEETTVSRKRVIAGWLGLGVVLLIAVAAWLRPQDVGRPRMFREQAYYFESLRVLNDIAAVGGDVNEAMQAASGVKAGDAQGWFNAWTAAGDRVSAMAARTTDPVSQGNAFLRAHNYYRSAEFFLAPDDPRRKAVWARNVGSFESGLNALGVAHERFAVPYGAHHLNAIYYPGPAGSEKRPLLMLVGGYDSTMEELYFAGVAAALQRGYSVLTYEGPGQGSVLREQHLAFEPDWEKPNGAVLDAFIRLHGKPAKIVLVGQSLGGYLAPRAAAFDSRIDGVVAFDAFYDGYAVATASMPSWLLGLHQHGHDGILAFLASLQKDPGHVWALQNGEWVFGVKGPGAVLDAFRPYRLAPVESRIRSDVLILAGDDDHFVPAVQAGEFARGLVNARSVTSIRFDKASGGGEHCQVGAPSVWQAAVFDWLKAKYPDASA
jgi:pimeloyl-ACP methyl ester carboxylesterase